MQVYIVYQLGYTGSNELTILGVFKDKEKAKKLYFKNIEDNIKECDFDFDKECINRHYNNGTAMMTRLFRGGYQENWDNYLEIYIEKQEVK